MQQDDQQVYDEQIQIDDDLIESPDPVNDESMQDELDPETAAIVAELAARHHNGASWFYWLAALSMLNTIIFMVGGDITFIFGLGVTQVIEAAMSRVAADMGSIATIAAVIINVVVLAVVALFSVFASRGSVGAFIVGIMLYAFDGLLFLMVGDLLSVAFHVFVLFFLFRGMIACSRLNNFEEKLAMTSQNTTETME